MDPSGDDIPTILAVDDNPSNLVALEGALGPLGYRIVTTSSGEEALRLLGEHDFFLILMDVHMPGLDGYQTTALLRSYKRSRDIPVIFLTAVYDQPEHTYRGYALGAVDYIAKPFDAEILRGKVRALVLLYMRGQRAERDRNQEAERIKDLFLGAVGHDLRNPLNVMILIAQMMLRDGDASARCRERAGKIERAGRRMQRMIEDVLDLTRGQFAGGIPLSPRSAKLGDLCRVAVEECRLARPGRVVQLDVEGDARGTWDPDRLERVVSNLLGNALEHCEEDPIRINVREIGDRAVLEVHNGGKPIEPDTLSTLFEPFHRGATSAKGLGLGLYIVHEIVRAHRGSVDVTSTPGEGTTFTVTLPKLDQGLQPESAP
jgi:signal transduction histidine kinase